MMENYAATLPDAMGNFSFPTGHSGFRPKAALILFPEAMRHKWYARRDSNAGPSA